MLVVYVPAGVTRAPLVFVYVAITAVIMECGACAKIQFDQGILEMSVDTETLCPLCSARKCEVEYLQSPDYLAWAARLTIFLASLGLDTKFQTAMPPEYFVWIEANPRPPR